ncbi:MAG: toll/interleukin-1 receptor domain-containing protein [Anaerolineales bacterium]
MQTKNKQTGKLFISYRRSDTRGIAGRLSDTLSAYFGDERVFRDIESIEGGADFGNVIEQNLQNADAVIVLIGQNWISAKNESGQRRLEDPQDWVAEEIAIAIQLKKPIFPVLVDGASMPRTEELPEKLKSLTRYNAISLSDDRWKSDVLRLGKIISFEIPSANERKLAWVNMGISLSIFASLSFVTGIVTWNFLQNKTVFLQLWQVGVPFVVIITSTLLLSSIVNLIDEPRKQYLYASMASGAIGSLIFFILLLFLNEVQEPMVLFFGSVLTGTLMLAFMNMSGFKSK